MHLFSECWILWKTNIKLIAAWLHYSVCKQATAGREVVASIRLSSQFSFSPWRYALNALSSVFTWYLLGLMAFVSGPCLLPPIAVRVSQPSDVALRLNYPRTTAVALQFDTNLTVASSILLNDSFTCTILEPCGSQPVWITSVDDSVVVSIIF